MVQLFSQAAPAALVQENNHLPEHLFGLELEGVSLQPFSQECQLVIQRFQLGDEAVVFLNQLSQQSPFQLQHRHLELSHQPRPVFQQGCPQLLLVGLSDLLYLLKQLSRPDHLEPQGCIGPLDVPDHLLEPSWGQGYGWKEGRVPLRRCSSA
jgi:hypothetical protein